MANLTYSLENKTLSSYVFGKKIKRYLNQLCHILGVPNSGVNQFYSRSWPYTDVTRLTAKQSIQPSIRHESEPLNVKRMSRVNHILSSLYNKLILGKTGRSGEIDYVGEYVLHHVIIG